MSSQQYWYWNVPCATSYHRPTTLTLCWISWFQERDFSQKFKFKARPDSKAHVKPSAISPVETGLVKRAFAASKGATVYEPTPLNVVDKKGSMITSQNENRTVTRNSSFFNPRTYAQSHTPTVAQGGVDGTPPLSFDMLQYLETILPSVESVLNKIRSIDSWWRCWRPVTSPNMAAILDFIKNL